MNKANMNHVYIWSIGY